MRDCGACRIKSNSQSNSWATERSPDPRDRGAADLFRDGADDGGLNRGAAMLCWAGRLQRRRKPMCACVRRRARRPNEQSRATTGERSRERPSRPLLAQELARRSLARHQPRSLNEVTAHHARLHCPILQHMQASEPLRWADRAQTDRVWRDFQVFGGRSPREERFALASPASSPSRTRPPPQPLSALCGAQGPVDGGCAGRSAPAPAPCLVWILFALRHHPHLALLDA